MVINMFTNLNLNNLKYFYEIVNTGNITKASNNLFLSQPALTKALKQLEKELNTRLLIRSKKGIVPTPEGEILYEYAKNIFQNLDKVVKTINQPQEVNHIYVGATTTNFLEPLLPSLKKFQNKYPNIKIHITLEEINVLEKYRNLNKLDILIKTDYEQIDNFKKIKSFEINDCFVASKKKFPELENKTISINKLLQYPFVLLSNITHGRKNFNNYLKSQNLKLTPAYEFNSYSLCRELIRNGFGIGVGNPIHYQSKEFIVLKTDFKLPLRKFDICFNTKSNNEYLKDLIEFIKNSL